MFSGKGILVIRVCEVRTSKRLLNYLSYELRLFVQHFDLYRREGIEIEAVLVRTKGAEIEPRHSRHHPLIIQTICEAGDA